MGYKTLNAITDPTFLDTGGGGGGASWTIEDDSGWAEVPGGGIKHTVAAIPVSDGYVGPSVYQIKPDMVDPFSIHSKCKLTINVDSAGGGANLHVHLCSQSDLEDDLLQGHHVGLLATISAPGTYEVEFSIPKTSDWVIALYGNDGTPGAVCTISSISLVLWSDGIEVEITSGEPNPTDTVPLPCIATFAEAVTGFDAGDIVAVNGNGDSLVVSNLATADNVVFTFDVTPDGDDIEVVYVEIAAGVATDYSGEGHQNNASNQFTRTYVKDVSGAPAAMTVTVEDQSEAA